MEPKFWLSRWKAGEIGFHQKDFEPDLIEYFPKVSPSKVLVPLCGKSYDMVWLAQQGHQVIGVELSAIACEAFFNEIIRQPYQKKISGEFTVYRGANYTLYCGDFFKIRPTDLAGVSLVYDRAALIALSPDLRRKYVSHLTALMESGGVCGSLQMLLIAIEYPQDLAQGPPFSVSDAEVNELYRDAFQVNCVLSEEIPEISKGNPKFQNVRVFSRVYLLKKVDGSQFF